MKSVTHDSYAADPHPPENPPRLVGRRRRICRHPRCRRIPGHPSVLITPLQDEFGWSRGTISAAVSVNLLLFGLTAPFAAALMDRFGMRRVVASAPCWCRPAAA